MMNLDAIPRCPICGQILNQLAVVFDKVLARCLRDSCEHAPEWPIINRVLRRKAFMRHWRLARGLRFFTPQISKPNDITAYDVMPSCGINPLTDFPEVSARMLKPDKTASSSPKNRTAVKPTNRRPKKK
jgi:hypothetical protein